MAKRRQKIEFYERQLMRQWWIYVLLIGLCLLFIFGCVQQLIFGISFGDNPMGDVGLLVTSILFILFSMLMLFGVKLHTYVNDEGIFIKYIPFQFRYKSYEWNAIDTWYIRKYSPIREYGGWGVRVGMNATTAYTVSGNRGLQLVLKNGKKVLIGTRRSDELEKALMELGKTERVKNV